MNDRDRLTNLILSTPKKEIVIGGRAQGRTYQTAQNIADHLLANGVTVLPCKVEQTVYIIENSDMLDIDPSVCSVVEDEIYEMGYGRTQSGELKWLFLVLESGADFYDSDIGKTVFLTREEADKVIAERKGSVEGCPSCAHMVSCEPNPFGTCKEYEERHDE